MKQTSKIAQVHAFSLIELMVTVAIVGILASAATPSFITEMNRARVASLIPLAEGTKHEIMEQHSDGIVYGAGTETKISSADTDKPKYLDSLVRDVYGCVSINYDTGALGLDSSEILSLVYCPSYNSDNDILSWNCGYSASSQIEYARYLPSKCRQEVIADTSF